MSISNALIKEGRIEERAYQKNISEVAKDRSTLIVLPTGMGKTIIALLVMAEVKRREPEGKILFLAPTKPLVDQHARDIEDILKVEEPKVFTGEVKPKDREEMWKHNDIIVSTPQVIRNDLMSQRITLDDVSLLVFDEAHRGVGSYAYVFIGEEYKEVDGLTLGLTASPGSEIDRILSVCENLDFERVEIRTKYDPDVINYVKKRDLKWVDVSLPSKQRRIVNKLKDILERDVKKLQDHGFLVGKKPDRVNRKDILEINKKVQKEIHSGGKKSLYNAASLVASCLKIDHAIAQAETQGPESLRSFLEKLKNEAESRGGTKAAKRLMDNPMMDEVRALLKNVQDPHPKIPETVKIVKEQLNKKEDSRIIVFTSYRNTVKRLTELLGGEEGVRPVRFVGQADKKGDKGLKQSDQVQAIDDFEEGKYNVLVATSVGEEGLDIPATDLVVFYEPVPSEIRTIQRRGRTARKRKGKVVILITKKTRDEGYYWSSKNKEKKMWRNLKRLKKELKSEIEVGDPLSESEEGSYDVIKKKSKKELKSRRGKAEESGGMDESQRSLMDFEKETEESEPQFEITIDSREQNNQVVKELSKRDININSATLNTGDYIISEDTAVERKSVDDFLSSLIDGRLFSQAKTLSRDYHKPVIILEGEGLFRKRNINDKAVYGALASISVDFQIPLLQTEDEEETAEVLHSMISRRSGKKGGYSLRKDKESMSSWETKKYILEGLPNISGMLAERLLEHFGNVKGVFEADKDELMEVKGIGEVTAGKIVDIIK